MMSQTEIETIVAPITAPGQAAVSVVRLSGANVEAILAKLCPKSEEILKHPRQVTFAEIIDHLNKNSSTPQTLDQALVTYFQHPASFTGEDICEFQLHGSPFLVERLVANCLHFGARMAEPGEFSKRAFLNGKLDLSQAEAVADLIAAETEGQARVAAEQLQGKLSQAMYLLGEPLRDLLAEIEAQIDFPEEDVGAENLRSWVSRIGKTQEEITRYLASFSTGRLYRDGATVSLVGLPNAGKSSLLNRLVGEERAIVTPIPGTTRDSIEERIAISGIYIRLWDTAGLIAEDVPDRQSDEVEILGIERSWKRLELSDLVLFVIDGTSDFSIEKQVFEKVRERVKELIVVINKIDLFPGHEAQPARQVSEELRTEDPVSLSALTAYGVQNLREKIGNKLLGNTSLGTSRVLITNQRHFEALKKSESFLGNALHALTQNTPLELIALDLRAALGALDDIIGITYNDDILGRIFSKFCIGK